MFSFSTVGVLFDVMVIYEYLWNDREGRILVRGEWLPLTDQGIHSYSFAWQYFPSL